MDGLELAAAGWDIYLDAIGELQCDEDGLVQCLEDAEDPFGLGLEGSDSSEPWETDDGCAQPLVSHYGTRRVLAPTPRAAGQAFLTDAFRKRVKVRIKGQAGSKANGGKVANMQIRCKNVKTKEFEPDRANLNETTSVQEPASVRWTLGSASPVSPRKTKVQLLKRGSTEQECPRGRSRDSKETGDHEYIKSEVETEAPRFKKVKAAVDVEARTEEVAAQKQVEASRAMKMGADHGSFGKKCKVSKKAEKKLKNKKKKKRVQVKARPRARPKGVPAVRRSEAYSFACSSVSPELQLRLEFLLEPDNLGKPTTRSSHLPSIAPVLRAVKAVNSEM